MKKLYILLTITAACAACNKDSDKPSNAITKENLVGSYKITSVKLTLFTPPLEVIDSLPACQRDDVYQLKPDDTYTLTDAGVQCSPVTTSSGTWSLSGNTFNLDGEDLAIESFNGTNLVVKGEQDFNGISVAGNITFTKQ
ncbi:lipocalin family protein [Foetidibacter luteolus]|uniref:lipocalin family protein n=1 Tax=Foetidibacter luteolus TaxID=2608880 RepID=UPI00129AC6F3|nr:lipocalin family protein [Foetidibacter luteolus]